ncbi:TetR family transcriptional regulator [Hwanghaeella sp. 1Z406]|uniref:TetR family transcriptional regulator n=1 Tax=Hwanghaeella sp. 1Z406 TaxID=3402811 RepID=UPI003B682C22
MVQKTERDLDAALIEAAMALFSERGYAAVRLQDIADRAEMDLGALRQRVANKLDILKLFLRRLDADVLGEDAGFGPEETVRDRLFDLLMRRFDALTPYRPALRAILQDVGRDPAALLCLAPHGMTALGWYLEAAGTSADGLRGAMRIKGLCVVWLHCLRIWEKDDSDDLAKTMKALDKALGQAERLATWMQSSPHRRASPNDVEADPSLGAQP